MVRSSFSAVRRLPAAMLVLAGLLVCLEATAAEPPFPRLGLYARLYGDGFPLLHPDGSVNDTAMAQYANYHEVIFEASPATDHRRDIIPALRAKNPNLSVLAYVAGHFTWFNPAVDTLTDFPYHYWQTVRDLNGFLYNKQGQLFPACDVNQAKRNAQGRYVVAEAIADLIYRDIVSTGLWDGVFLDIFCESVLWVETPTDSFDYVRAGYATRDAFDQAWGEGQAALGNRLRTLVGASGFVLVGNCGRGTRLYGAFNGWMRENFPFQNGGTWYANMLRTQGGYLPDDLLYRPPPHNYLFTAASSPTSAYTADNRRRVRFGLGSAALGEGLGVFGYSARDVRTSDYYAWWYDEYAVDLTSGQSSASPQFAGWLGQPLGPHYQMIWLSSAPDGVSNPGFETDLSGWTFQHWASASLAREPTSAPQGGWVAHVRVDQSSSFDWYVSLATTGTLPMSWGAQYSATFWAKAGAPRNLAVVLFDPVRGELANQTVSLTTQWKRYQVVLSPNNVGNAKLYFYFANTAGDVWLDDIHYQPGTSNLYRRDFQNGCVLVNPSASAMSVPLERAFRKIRGIVSPEVNDGTTVTGVTIAASDALFLIGDDVTPPAVITNFRTSP